MKSSDSSPNSNLNRLVDWQKCTDSTLKDRCALRNFVEHSQRENWILSELPRLLESWKRLKVDQHYSWKQM